MKLPDFQQGSRPTRQERRGGVAIVIVMISIFVLSMLAGGFALSMKVETRLAQNGNNEAKLEWLGRSGVDYVCWILAQEVQAQQQLGGIHDSLDQVWAGGSGGPDSTNGSLVNVEKEVRLGDGSFTWEVIDLERKANINTASEAVLQQALNLMQVDAGQITPIVSSIEDWIDPDDTTHLQGAESDYYKTLDDPYPAKNGPIDDISELLLIKGVTPEIYWGAATTNHPGRVLAAQQNFFGFDQNQQAFTSGLVDLFTPFSSGKINVNTASADVLQLVPGIDAGTAQTIVSERDGEDDPSGLTGPFHNTQQLFSRVPQLNSGGQANFNRQFGQAINQYLTVASSTFEVHIDADVGGYKRRFIAIVRRDPPANIRILSFYWE
jgi:general secretion pathway protein K